MIYDKIKDLLPQQYKDSTEINIILQVLSEPFDEIKAVAQDVKNLLDIDSNSGVQLDLIGEIVVQKRNGLNDADYREFLKFKIKKNTSKATVDDVVSILKFLTKATRVVYSDNEPASYTIYTNGQTIPPKLREEMDKITGAGINLIMHGTIDGSKPIVFLEQVDNLVNEDLLQENGEPILQENGEPILATLAVNDFTQILLTDEDGFFIMDETGALVADNDFVLVKDKVKNISNYELYDGVPLGYHATEFLLQENGEPLLLENGENLVIMTDITINEGKLVLEL